MPHAIVENRKKLPKEEPISAQSDFVWIVAPLAPAVVMNFPKKPRFERKLEAASRKKSEIVSRGKPKAASEEGGAS